MEFITCFPFLGIFLTTVHMTIAGSTMLIKCGHIPLKCGWASGEHLYHNQWVYFNRIWTQDWDMSLNLHKYVYWVECPLKYMFKVLTLQPQISLITWGVTLFGNRVFTDVTQVKMGSEEQRQVYKKEWYWCKLREARGINPNSIWSFFFQFQPGPYWAPTIFHLHFQGQFS